MCVMTKNKKYFLLWCVMYAYMQCDYLNIILQKRKRTNMATYGPANILNYYDNVC